MNNETGSGALEGETDPFADVGTRPVSPRVKPLADAYDEQIGDRDRSLWRWFTRSTAEFQLSCVDPEQAQVARDAKVLATMFITVIDDVAECHGDRETVAELLKVPFEHQRADPTRAGVASEYVEYQQELWSALRDAYADGPRAEEFVELLLFDIRQAFQAVEYSALMAQYPTLATERELWTYDAHNMMVCCFADIDLANASSFDIDDLAVVRRVVFRTQRLARIGNWIATWERELTEGDCSSAVVVRALETGVIDASQLRAVQERSSEASVDSVVAAIRESSVEEHFVDRWDDEYAAAATFASAADSVDLQTYLEGFETIFRAQLANRPSS